VRRTTRLLVVLLALCLVAAGCGARFNKDQKAALRAGNVTSANGSGGNGVTAGGSGDAATAGGDNTATTTPGAGAGSTGGGATGGAATGGGGTGAPSGGDNGGASDVGVTGTTLTVGNVSIISGPVPGFGTSSQRAVQAYINYVNSQGGVYGRKLALAAADDRFDSGANRSQTEQLKTKVFAFVGGLSVVDDGGAAVLNNTNIPDVGLSLSDGRIKLPNNFSPAPIDLAQGGNGVQGAMAYYKAQGAVKGAVIWPGQAIARARAQGYVKDMQRAGLTVDYQAEVSTTETNYSGLAAQIQQKKIDVVITTLEVNGMASLAKALKQQGYQPKVADYGAQAYGPQFLKLAGSAAEGVTLNVAYDIFENRANDAAMNNFLTWFSRTAPGQDPDYFSILAWSAADLFVRALKAAGPKATRDTTLAELKKITSFDAGGMLAPINPAAKHWADCFLVVKVVNGKWTRVEPAASGFHC
jgi:branched-chain amino acid transport system substrate-binding protein